MLNKNAIQILNSITNISNSVILSYPITTISNPSSDVLVNIDFSQIEDEFQEYGIYDLNSFLGALGILNEPTIKLSEGVITAKDEDSSIQFIVSDTNAMVEFTTNPENITSTCAAASVVEVEMNTDLMGRIRKGASVFKTLKDIFITKVGDELSIRTGNKETFNSRSNSFSVKLDPILNTGGDFEVAIPIDNFLSLPSMDFTLKVKYNEKADQHRIVMENKIFQAVLTVKV